MQWDMNPVIFQSGPIALRWYGLFFASAFIAGFRIMQWIYEKEGRNPDELENLFIYMFIGTVAGARIGHCFFYEPLYFIQNPLDIIKIWEGGLASHGGAIGIILAIYLYSGKKGMPGIIWLLDRIVIPSALGGAFIRIGNFFNSEITGTPYDGLWAVVFERIDQIPRHPVQIYEALAYISVFIVLVSVYSMKNKSMKDGFVSGLFLVMIFLSRFILEFFKTDQAAYESGFIISVGQWLSLPFVIAGFFMILRSLKKKPLYTTRLSG